MLNAKITPQPQETNGTCIGEGSEEVARSFHVHSMPGMRRARQHWGVSADKIKRWHKPDDFPSRLIPRISIDTQSSTWCLISIDMIGGGGMPPPHQGLSNGGLRTPGGPPVGAMGVDKIITYEEQCANKTNMMKTFFKWFPSTWVFGPIKICVVIGAYCQILKSVNKLKKSGQRGSNKRFI